MKNILFLIFSVFLIVATRGHESWANTNLHLPDFTIPALLIAGVYFRSNFIAITLIVAAVAIDNYAIVYKGISANCITPAYSFLPFTYYAVFWFSKFLTSFVADKNIIKNSIVILLIVSIQWFLATISYYTFVSSSWENFPSYALHWSVVEILPTLYFVAATMVVLTFAKIYIPFFGVQVAKH